VLALPGASLAAELSLRVETARIAGRTLQVALRNTAPQIVRAFCTTFDGSGVELTELLPPRQTGILPGQTYLVRSDLGPEVKVPEAAAASFSVTCVLFDDGSREGLPEHLSMMSALRRGRELQEARLAPLLQSLMSAPDDNLGAAVVQTIDQIRGMDITLEDGSRAVGLQANGIRSANTLLTRGLERARVARGTRGVEGCRLELENAMRELQTIREHLQRDKR
jgi:hypothetical protein